MYAAIPILIFVVRMVLYAANRSGGSGGAAQTGPRRFSSSGRSVAWLALAVAWAVVAFAMLVDLLGDGLLAGARRNVPELLVVASGGAALFFAWPLLRRLARLGRPRLVYHLAHLALIFPRTGETYAGAALLAGLALSHRGRVTREELDWLASRIAKAARPLGTYAAALAVHHALEARVAQDARRVKAAAKHSENARMLLGTLTYASKAGAPKGVLAFANGWLALNEARLGLWWGVDPNAKTDLGASGRALCAWVDVHLRRGPEEGEDGRDRKRKKTTPMAAERARSWAKHPVVDKLFARTADATPGLTSRQAHAQATSTYLALIAGEPVSVSAMMGMLRAFDILLDPRFPETLLPEAVRADEEELEALYEEVATAVTEPIAGRFVPIHALGSYGPVSARVYQKLEQRLVVALEHACRRSDERVKLDGRRNAAVDWLEASRLRVAFRRLGVVLGSEGAAQVWPLYAGAYGRLGCLLAETQPRRRPLAHAVFKALWMDAVQFEDEANVTQQAHNMRVTSGVD